MSSLQKKIELDFEVETRKILDGIKRIRRWRPRTKPSWLARIRGRFAAVFAWIANIFLALSRRTDPWKVTMENVLEHSFKQVLLVMRMLIIERAHNNPHGLDIFRLLSWPVMHDLPEGDPKSQGDVNYWEKRKDLQTKLASRQLEAKISQEIMRKLFSYKYRRWHSFNLDMDPAVSENEKIFWTAAEEISHCLFMLEELKIGKLPRARKECWRQNILNVHVKWMRENAWHFASVREIVENEILLKWYQV